MPSDDLIVNRVLSTSTATPGRSVSQVRTHQLVIDEPVHAGGPGVEITPAEAFLAGISACGVLLVQGQARASAVRLDKAEVTIEAVRHRSDPSIFQQMDLRFRLIGPTQAEALDLVAHYQRH